MSLENYTDETRADIVDGERLVSLFDEIESVLADLSARLTQLENRTP